MKMLVTHFKHCKNYDRDVCAGKHMTSWSFLTLVLVLLILIEDSTKFKDERPTKNSLRRLNQLINVSEVLT